MFKIDKKKYFSNRKKILTIEKSLKYSTSNIIKFNGDLKEVNNPQNKKEYFTEFGKIIINGDGTISDMTNKLMWISAPWGMKWNGKNFKGIPLETSWFKLSNLFGKGIKIRGLYDSYQCFFFLKEEDFKLTDKSYGYYKGNAKIKFANYTDWRLPTIDEASTIKPNHVYSEVMSNETFNFPHCFWTANWRNKNIFSWVLQKTGVINSEGFPDDSLSPYVAWECNPRLTKFKFRAMYSHVQNPILFVRNIL